MLSVGRLAEGAPQSPAFLPPSLTWREKSQRREIRVRRTRAGGKHRVLVDTAKRFNTGSFVQKGFLEEG